MKIAVVGANGWVGSTVAREALERGHTVTAVVRDPARLTLAHERLHIVIGDATNPNSVAEAVRGHDVVIGAISGRRDANNQNIPNAAQALLVGVAQAGVQRLIWVGGAGSLEVAPGVRLIDTPEFPAEYKGEALAQADALGVFRSAQTDIGWTYISPAVVIAPGQRIGQYRVGGDQVLANDTGKSYISVEDYGVALLDEVEQPKHNRRRITVAY
jgi:uncharacterized protein